MIEFLYIDYNKKFIQYQTIILKNNELPDDERL
jgi:hypothetical protein